MPNQFTPGPWVAQSYKQGTKRFRIIQNPYGLIADVVVGNPANPRVNTEADARLIAAAPALYDALNQLVKDIESGEIKRYYLKKVKNQFYALNHVACAQKALKLAEGTEQ